MEGVSGVTVAFHPYVNAELLGHFVGQGTCFKYSSSKLFWDSFKNSHLNSRAVSNFADNASHISGKSFNNTGNCILQHFIYEDFVGNP